MAWIGKSLLFQTRHVPFRVRMKAWGMTAARITLFPIIALVLTMLSGVAVLVSLNFRKK